MSKVYNYISEISHEFNITLKFHKLEINNQYDNQFIQLLTKRGTIFFPIYQELKKFKLKNWLKYMIKFVILMNLQNSQQACLQINSNKYIKINM